MALVIFCVALVEAMRTRMSFSEAILSSPRRSCLYGARPQATLLVGPGRRPGRNRKSSSKRLGVTFDHALQLAGEIVGEIAAVTNAVENLDVLAAQQRQQTIFEGAHLVERQ